MIKPGHIQRVRYTIESSEQNDKPLYKITALMRCDVLLAAALRSRSVGAKWEHDVALLGLATKLEKKTKKHLKGCKTCRIARRKLNHGTR